MNEQQKQSYNERYLQEKQKGVKFWPDILYKDLIFSFAIFLLLVGLATFLAIRLFVPVGIHSVFFILYHGIAASMMLALLGVMVVAAAVAGWRLNTSILST